MIGEHGYGIARWVEDTVPGREHLRDEVEGWLRYTTAIAQVLRAAPAMA